jgi:DNA polymerase-3 subunit epsilon
MNLAVAIDLETTGFGFKKADRIVEIAGVVFDLSTGETVASFETLINPLRNVPEKSTEIHGLTAAHLSMAPTFEEVAPWLAHTLGGKRVIAHNALFDVNFLNSEFAKANLDFTVTEFDCTCRMSNNASLKNAALDLDLQYDAVSHHGALYDAILCAEIFKNISSSKPETRLFSANASAIFSAEIQMPTLVTRKHLGIEPSSMRDTFSLSLGVNQIVDDPVEACYLWRLADFLSDLVITEAEIQELDVLADALGISKRVQEELHVGYVRQLERAALRDGLVTESEQILLTAISEQLGVPLEIEFANSKAEIPLQGSLICVTGTAKIKGTHWGKSEISDFLEAHGFIFTDELTKASGVALLLQDSEGSQSSKVEKARKWGIPRMTIESFIETINGQS